MAKESYLSGNTAMLVLRLLEMKDMYGYQIIEVLAEKSDETFRLKTGTLYPILHSLEKEGMVSSYDESAGSGRVRKYYHITRKGLGLLSKKQDEWVSYQRAVNHVLDGGASYAAI